MNILVIDDEPIIHESLKKVLAREGFHVDTVMSGREGLELLSAADYDLIITDLMMPEMDGLELLREMEKASYMIPTIMITGYPTIRTALQALRLGAADYIPKPFTRKELLPPIRRALRKKLQDASSIETSATHGHAHRPKQENGVHPPIPGDRFRLPEHSWALYNQNGTVKVGIEGSFLRSINRVVGIHLPLEDDLVEQGFPGIALITSDGEEHNVFLPLSGRVVGRNDTLLDKPSALDSDTWLIQVIPSQLKEELPYLQRDPKP